jgi:hypothetical protein
MLFKLAFIQLVAGSTALCAQLYAAHYTGNIHLLNFQSNWYGGYSLTNIKSVTGCGKMPAWLTLDIPARRMYCSDEDWDQPEAALSTFSMARNNELKEIARANSTSSVHNTLFGYGFIANAH